MWNANSLTPLLCQHKLVMILKKRPFGLHLKQHLDAATLPLLQAQKGRKLYN